MTDTSAAASSRQPTLYLPHGGGPCFFMTWSPPDEWDLMAEWLRSIATTLPSRPRALVVISAHWEAGPVTVLTGAAPPLLYDYFGFPPDTYEITYPAPGDPALATRVQELLGAAGIPTAADADRGFDHGVFIPLKLVFPEADIPIVQVSLEAGLDPAHHLAIGAALAPLRDEGVLIVGSGMSYHNMQAFGSGPSLTDSDEFDEWLGRVVRLPGAERVAALTSWESAPSARSAHPREEHLLPLMVVAGAANGDEGRKVFTDRVMSATVSGVQFG